MQTHPSYTIRQKPILITRLTSALDGMATHQWTNEALELMQERYPTIRGVVFTDSLDWQLHRTDLLAVQPR